MRSLRVLARLSLAHMKARFIYVGRVYSALLGSLVTVPLSFFIWSAAAGESDEFAGVSRSGILVYALAARLLRALEGTIDVGGDLRSGDICTSLVRPLDFRGIRIASGLGELLGQLVLGFVPALIAILAIFRPVPLLSWQAVVFPVSIVLALAVVTLCELLVDLWSFWTVNEWGLYIVWSGVRTILSGAIVPVMLFPPWLAEASYFSPFAAMLDVPLRLLATRATPGDGLTGILLQVFWVGFLWVAVSVVWRRAERRLLVFGG